MEYKKYILVPIDQKMNDLCKPILNKAFELYKEGKINDKLNILVNGEFKKDTNVIDYFLDLEHKLPFSREFSNLNNRNIKSKISNTSNKSKISNKSRLFTTKSPIKLKWIK